MRALLLALACAADPSGSTGVLLDGDVADSRAEYTEEEYQDAMERAASSSYTKHEYEAEDPVPADRGDDGEKDQLPSEGGVLRPLSDLHAGFDDGDDDGEKDHLLSDPAAGFGFDDGDDDGEKDQLLSDPAAGFGFDDADDDGEKDQLLSDPSTGFDDGGDDDDDRVEELDSTSEDDLDTAGDDLDFQLIRAQLGGYPDEHDGDREDDRDHLTDPAGGGAAELLLAGAPLPAVARLRGRGEAAAVSEDNMRNTTEWADGRRLGHGRPWAACDGRRRHDWNYHWCPRGGCCDCKYACGCG